MPSIADMERTDRLQGLWDALVKGLPRGANRGQFSDYDPLQALGTQGGYGRPNIDPYTALRFLQLGQALGPLLGKANDEGMLATLIQQFMAQSQKQR